MSSIPATVVKALTLLDLVADHPGLNLSEIAAESGIPNATAHRLLKVLIRFELIRMTTDHRYHLGSHCLALGSQFLNETDLRVEALPYLEDIVEKTGETTHLGMRDGISVVYVEKVETKHPVRMYSRVGALSPMYSTAIGKALLAFGEDEILERVVDAGLERRTPNTITDPLRLRSELDRIRSRIYAIDDVENEAGIRCVAAPVRTADGSALGAISISGPTSRITDERIVELGELLLECTSRL